MFDVCVKLSSDGAAAVLGKARLLLEIERQKTPRLQSLDLYDFSRRVMLVVKEAKDGLYRGDRIFLASVHRILLARGDAEGMTLRDFKRRLVEAHHRRHVVLSTCRRFRDANPLIVAASAVRARRNTFHLLHRFSHGSVQAALIDVILALSVHSHGILAVHAIRVLEDERLRRGRPRLVSLFPEQFASRVQEVVDRQGRDVSVVELHSMFEELGEATGLGLHDFRARLAAADRSGRLSLSPLDVVKRSNAPLPIPWGRPAPIVPPRRASFAEI